MRKLLDVALAVCLLVVLTLLVSKLDNSETVTGFATVTDGDSLVLGSERIRLYGIDAPEFSQICAKPEGEYPCGRYAKDALERLVSGVLIVCETQSRDRYGRLLAECRINNTNIGEEMVREGWAVSYGAYRSVEHEARSTRRGIWQGEFDTPQLWRRIHDAEEKQPDSFATWLREMLKTIFNGNYAGGEQ